MFRQFTLISILILVAVLHVGILSAQNGKSVGKGKSRKEKFNKESQSKKSKEKSDSNEIDIDHENKTLMAKCSNNWIKKFPHVKRRFSDVILQEHCKHGGKWVKEAKSPVKKKIQLSPDQTNWLTGVWKCKDLMCICRSVELCNNFLMQLESGFQKLKGLGDGVNKNLADLLGVKTNEPPSNFLRSKRQTLKQINDLVEKKVGKASRKEIRMMNNEEKSAFLKGVNKLKTQKIGDKSKYEMLVMYHTPEQSPEAHFCAAFFPFHRELLKSIEMAMREVEPMAALPYWDPTIDQPLPDPKDSVLWTDELLGNGDGDVINGPFVNWTTMPDAQIQPLSNSMKIHRGIGTSPYGSLLKDSDIQTILDKASFRDMSYCNDPFLELIHGATHMWVGGHMIELRTSPNDPTFFLYHNYLDYIWEKWRQSKQDRKQRETDYPSDQESCNTFCAASAQMKPFPIKNSDGLSNYYTDTLYSYEPTPTCSSQTATCGSPYLFCDTRTYKCISKVKVNGNCTGFESQDICYKSKCSAGRCVLSTEVVTTLRPTFPPTTVSQATVLATTATEKVTFPPTVAPVQPTGVPVKTVWIPITVVTMTGETANAYDEAVIISTDVGHGVKYNGVVSDPSKVPYYTGAAFAQVLNPFTVSDGVEATIQVFNEDMTECSTMCLSPETKLYAPCSAKVTLSSNILSSDTIAFSPDFEQARLLNWQRNKRLPDKFLFICRVGVTTEPNIVIITKAASTTTSAYPLTTAAPIFIKNETGGIHIDQSSTTQNLTEKIMNGGCRNLHRCCSIWSGVGECKRNPWMQLSCQKDCGVCQDGVDLGKAGCIDYHTDCPKLAAEKQCTQNQMWTEENCRKSCDVCDRNIAQLLVLCGVSGGAEKCIDTQAKCKSWAANQECERNPWWMKENCAVSCNSCKPNN